MDLISDRTEIVASTLPGEHDEDGDHGTEGKIHGCQLCDSSAASLESLKEHYQLKHSRFERKSQTHQSVSAWAKKNHACPHCDYRSNQVGHIKRHVLTHTGETPLNCTHCDFKCRDSTVLRRHVNGHLRNESKYKFEGGKYQCQLCNFTTSFNGALTTHIRRHADPKICQHCRARFWKEETFSNHLLLHAGVASFQCKSCDYKTNVASSLKNHEKRIHATKKSWVCSECNYATSCPSDLSKHKTVHKSERPFACTLCKYTSKRRSHLLAHQATHNDNLKKYSCQFCDYRTALISTLRVHIRKHTGEKPYKCDECEATFTSPGGAKCHSYTHIKNWSQSCTYCDFTASRPNLFSEHLRIHKRQLGQLPSKTDKTRLPSKPSSTKTSNVKSPQCSETPKTKPTPDTEDEQSIDEPDEDVYPMKIEPDEDVYPMKIEPDCSTQGMEDIKIEDIDISYPVKQEYS